MSTLNGHSQALIYAQVVLAFDIPFALIPLLLETRGKDVIKEIVDWGSTSVLMVLVTITISGMNGYERAFAL
jgi:manganese transport protein